MLIDSHAHLNMSQFSGDREDAVRRALSSNVGEILNVGFDTESIKETIELTEEYGQIYAAVGLHPHEAGEWNDGLERDIKALLLRRKVLAVGEIGLDYYRDLSPRDIQRDVFRKQIGIALYFGKPIVVHCREAFEDVIKILREEGAGEVGGIFHAFPGGTDEAEEILDLGFLLGLGGPVTYKNSRLPETVERLPSSGFVTETDCPYLPPVPYRGKRNEPAYVALVAEKLADVRRVALKDIERAAEASYRRVMHGEEKPPPSVAYSIKNNLYLNVTNFCTNDCVFCHRTAKNNLLYGYNLDLVTEPDSEDVLTAAKEQMESEAFDEVVFCGYGEPTARLDVLISVATALRSYKVPIRLNTNGHGNLINQRNIIPELEKVFDRISVSLNASGGDEYLKICRPDRGGGTYGAVIDFIRTAAESDIDCVVTAVDYPGADIKGCEKVVQGIRGAEFRKRVFHLPPPK